MSILKTLSNGFEHAITTIKPKPLETPKTKAITKAREKAIGTWRELVEAAHQDKAIPEEWIVQKLGSEIGIVPAAALATFEADVQGYSRAKNAVASLQKAEARVKEHFDTWQVETPLQFEAKRRDRLEALQAEQRQLEKETKLYNRDMVSVQRAKSELHRADQCERILPHGEETQVKEND